MVFFCTMAYDNNSVWFFPHVMTIETIQLVVYLNLLNARSDLRKTQ